MNRADLQQLADLRIAEAGALLGLPAPMADGAYYLAGYAVECALKACIAKLTNEHDFPPDMNFVRNCYTHDLVKLLRAAGSEPSLDADIKANLVLGQNWLTVKDWNEQARYERHSPAEARQLYDAITDGTNGVLPWIKARW